MLCHMMCTLHYCNRNVICLRELLSSGAGETNETLQHHFGMMGKQIRQEQFRVASLPTTPCKATASFSETMVENVLLVVCNCPGSRALACFPNTITNISDRSRIHVHYSPLINREAITNCIRTKKGQMGHECATSETRGSTALSRTTISPFTPDFRSIGTSSTHQVSALQSCPTSSTCTLVQTDLQHLTSA